tara:strand:+ start:566 stop:709 length:144 start_codon:yes stop_codon:yes gene_type:complete
LIINYLSKTPPKEDKEQINFQNSAKFKEGHTKTFEGIYQFYVSNMTT